MDSAEFERMQDLARRWVVAQPAVAAFISSAIPDFHDAQDVLQRTAGALVRKAADYDPTQPFNGWAIGVAKFEILRYRRAAQRDRLKLNEAALDAVADAAERVSDDVAEMRQALDVCFEKLQGRPRKIFDLHYFQSRTFDRIAELLKVSKNAVFVALHRARTELRRCMEQRLGIEGELT